MARHSMKQGFAKYTSQINRENLILKGKFCDPNHRKILGVVIMSQFMWGGGGGL